MRDIKLADCQVVLTDSRYVELLQGLTSARGCSTSTRPPGTSPRSGTGTARSTRSPATPHDLLMLVFTSGTSGDPKAVRCHPRQGRRLRPDARRALRARPDDTAYVAMPMFHSNAIMAGWAVGLAAGARLALRRRFSASGFLDDIRKFGATYANYVGKPLSYVLATTRARRRRGQPAAA